MAWTVMSKRGTNMTVRATIARARCPCHIQRHGHDCPCHIRSVGVSPTRRYDGILPS
ncbi:MAG: hypothetical protein NZ874_09855 [Fimbriimonadales bacterium]|nr:hypothetical protein [Fimbriimonadales bacterium]